ILPKTIKVAVPSPQHSPILGQLPGVQVMFRLYLSTRPLSRVYFWPVGSLTLSHLGFPLGVRSFPVTLVLIVRGLVHKDTILQRKTAGNCGPHFFLMISANNFFARRSFTLTLPRGSPSSAAISA